jgi:uroporphyrinogen-III synthase
MILITRPRLDALDFARELKKLDLSFQIESVISIRLKKPKINYENERVYLVTSIYAVRALMLLSDKELSSLKKKSFIVIGLRVRDALKKLGINKIKLIASNSESLLVKITNTKQKFKINYICSNYYNRDLKDKLVNLTLDVNLIHAYSTLSKKKLSQRTIDLFFKKKISSVSFFSINTAKVFFNLVRESEIERESLKSIKFLCLSKNIGNYVKMQKYHNVNCSENPNKKSLLSLIKKINKNQ